jgi:hypothetical protein
MNGSGRVPASRAWGLLAAMTGLLVGLAGCAHPSTQPTDRIGPPLWTAATCPQPRPHAVVLGEPTARHAIPGDFRANRVLRCVITQDPNSPAQLVTEQATLSPAAATNLVGLLSAPSSPPSAAGCPADPAAHTVLVPYFVLVDALDHALLPGMPLDGCGFPQQAVIRALSALPPYTRLSSSPIR